MSKTILSIPNPCAEKWSEMTPIHSGCRHCAACDRQILDFSHYSDAELRAMLQMNHGKLCGRFRNDQLERPLVAPPAKRVHFFRKSRWSIAATVAALLSVEPAEAQAIEGKDPVEQTLAQSSSVQSISVADSIRIISGKVTDEKGEPMVGASVRFSNSPHWVHTDIDGIFALRVPIQELGADSTLQISVHYTGYKTITLYLPSRIRTEDLTLSPAQTQMIEAATFTMGILVSMVDADIDIPRKRPIRQFFYKLFH